MRSTLMAVALLSLTVPAWASDPTPTPVPLTRPELKQLLEESKKSVPRLKAPAPTPEQVAAAKARGATAGRGFGGGQGNGLLPPELRGGYFMPDGRGSGQDMRGLRGPNSPERPAAANRPNFPRVEPDPNMTLDYAFKVMLFWIVSRSNNCVYCTGHQENKLTAAGVTEDRIAALDGDWSEFTHAERAAFALTRKLTVAPQTITDADIEAAKKHFTNLQVLEIITTVAGFNGMNRWTGPLRLTQQENRIFLTPTTPKYETIVTKIGPVAPGCTGARCAPVAAPRPALEPRSEVEAKLAECRDRASRFALVDESAARALLPADLFPADKPLPNWVRLLANFPKSGPVKVAHLRASHTKGNLPPKLKAELAWVSARADRAWYALACARERLRALDVAADTIFAIDQGTDSKFTSAERAAFAFARKLTVDPALIGDGDFDGLKKYYSDSEIAELIHHVNQAVFFNLVTEAASLPLDGGSSKVVSQR
jgi:AhpD family alkylhydroperoxidase